MYLRNDASRPRDCFTYSVFLIVRAAARRVKAPLRGSATARNSKIPRTQCTFYTLYRSDEKEEDTCRVL